MRALPIWLLYAELSECLCETLHICALLRFLMWDFEKISSPRVAIGLKWKNFPAQAIDCRYYISKSWKNFNLIIICRWIYGIYLWIEEIETLCVLFLNMNTSTNICIIYKPIFLSNKLIQRYADSMSAEIPKRVKEVHVRLSSQSSAQWRGYLKLNKPIVEMWFIPHLTKIAIFRLQKSGRKLHI